MRGARSLDRSHIKRHQIQAVMQELLQRHQGEDIPVKALEDMLSQSLQRSIVSSDARAADARAAYEQAPEEEIDLDAIVNSLGGGGGLSPGMPVLPPPLEEGSGQRPSVSVPAQPSYASIPGQHSASVGGHPGTPTGLPASLSGAGREGAPAAQVPPTALPPVAFPQIRGDAQGNTLNPVAVTPRERHLDPTLAPSDDEVPTRWGRYPVDGELARGGQGRILNAYDEIIGRPVALKILRREGINDARLVTKFRIEAMITGQLEHPNIVPVHELGELDNGLPFYTMKKVEGRTLKKVIIGLRKANPAIQSQYGRMKLINILLQVCQAIAYAHEKGVLHRDLKPANIMLGDYGETIVLDWGVAKVRSLKDSSFADGLRPVRIAAEAGAMDTQAGTIEGTPAYMAPEQARGRVHEIDERSDVYAIGAILYEILTFRPPFKGQDVREVLRQVVDEMPPHPHEVAPQNQIPEELIAIALKCLNKNPARRYASVRAVQEDLEAFLEGTKKREKAVEKVKEARALVEEHMALKRELVMARSAARLSGSGIQGWEPIERKRGLWATLNRVRDIEAKIAVTFGRAVALFSQALAHEPDNADAKAGLADLYLEQLKQSEQQGDHSRTVFAESMVAQYHNDRYAAFLQGDGYLSVEVEPRGAEVWLYEYEEQERVLRPVRAKRLGLAPVREVRLPRNSYLLVLRAAGYRDVYYPVRLDRQEHHVAVIRMYSHEQIGQGFIYVPGSKALLGGDPDAIDAMEREARFVPDFAISEFPVTFREYVEFLNAWLAVDPAEALRRVPRLESSLPLVELQQNGYVPSRAFLGGEGPTLLRPGAELDIPVFGIDWDDADAFCAWRTEVSGREYRLPTEDEWEKAARGVDGRCFPWGSHFDPIFCKSRSSRPYSPMAEPVGRFTVDTSPYGVRDLAGGVREWCDGWFLESQELRVMRGGSWVDTEHYARCASRSFYDPHLIKRIGGFRCARSLG